MAKDIKVKVIVPMYRSALSEYESISLDSICTVLKDRPIVVVHPEGLDLSHLRDRYPALQFKSFEPSMFAGIRGYNRLMTSPDFYRAFDDSEYILIAQLDTYFFSDDLDEWCGKGYDYVGAPWLVSRVNACWLVRPIKRLLDWLHVRQKGYSKIALYDKVGNGGLSLRQVDSHLRAAVEHADELARLNQVGKKGFPEDVFWATRVEGFSYPTAQEALSFAFDKYPAYSYELTGGKLPMGCHAWFSRKMRSFWFPIILKP